MEQVLTELKRIEGEINTRIEKANEQAKDAAADSASKVESALKTEIANLVTKYNELQGEYDKINIRMQERESISKSKGQTFEQAFIEKVSSKKEELSQIMKLKGRSVEFDFDTKAIVLESSALTGDVIAPDRRSGIVTPPQRRTHVRNLMRVGSTSSNSYGYNEETAYTDATATRAEGAAYGQSDMAMEFKQATVYKIAAKMDLSEEILEDIPGLFSYVSGRLRDKYMLVEDQKLLFGAGGSDITGVHTAGSAFVQTGAAVTSANYFDVLAKAAVQATVNEYMVTAALVNPANFTDMGLTKDSAGNYVIPEIFRVSIGAQILSFPIIPTTAMTAGNFLVGDFERSAEIIDRRSLTVQLSTENNDNFEKGLVTARLSTRLALPIYFPGGFVKGAFSTATGIIST